jgi:UDP-2-acetamido-3-amino-2,3-dideoxy-glucuronate N-acetyltransferase
LNHEWKMTMPIAASVKLGNNVFIPQPDLINLYGYEIGNDTKIGVFVEIQKCVIRFAVRD